MQIVQRLAGYTLGRSDLVRRAMSKKKAAVMEKERQNFVYGNPEEGVPGCIANGIPEKTAQKIYDEMIDFAKYAFNKSHAAAYAVVSYQTAYLKYYYPVEFMAALMTSVLDNSNKVAEYILSCRQMGLEILSPNINESESRFSVSDGKIRFALSAIKSIGRPVVEAIVAERKRGGPYKGLQDFAERMADASDCTKRTVENLIKAGAFDGLGGTRQQFVLAAPGIMDSVAQSKKTVMSGQMSLFDLVDEEEKQRYQPKLPDIGEYPKDVLLAYEKDVLGIYLSGHPLEEYEARWRRNITAQTTDFLIDEETNRARVSDGQRVVVGGMIAGKTVKFTKNNKPMAFLQLEDLLGSVEVIVFPNVYERSTKLLQEDARIFVAGHADVSDDRAAKLICDRIVSFDEGGRELWIQFPDQSSCLLGETELLEQTEGHAGEDALVLYAAKEKTIKRLPKSCSVRADADLLEKLRQSFGKENVKLTEKRIENLMRMR